MKKAAVIDSLSCSGPEVGFGEISIDLLQARLWIASCLPTTHPEPVLTQQHPLKVRVRQPNVQRLATVLGNHPRHPVRLSKSDKAEHCSKEDAVPEGGAQDFTFLADQTDGRDSDRNVLR